MQIIPSTLHVLALRGDLCWSSVNIRGKLDVFRLWLFIERSSDNRITSIVHKWGLSKNISWESRVNILARKIGVIDVVNDVSMSTKTRLSEICDVLTDNDTAKWERDLKTQIKSKQIKFIDKIQNKGLQSQCTTHISIY
jgi:hypothetical protein